MSAYSWIEHISTIAGIPLALIGFAVTIWQLVKTRGAAVAARLAAEKATKNINRTTLLMLVPQLMNVEG